MYSSIVGVLALRVPGTGAPESLQILLAIVLLAALASAVYFIGREYINIGRRGYRREPSVQLWLFLGLTILGVMAFVGHNWT